MGRSDRGVGVAGRLIRSPHSVDEFSYVYIMSSWILKNSKPGRACWMLSCHPHQNPGSRQESGAYGKAVGPNMSMKTSLPSTGSL